jgi:hypothetical protein
MARKLDPKSKAGFVRSQPASLSAAEVVTKAKGAGLKLDVQYVYKVRGAKKKRGRPAAKAAVSVSAPATPVRGGFAAEIERFAMEQVAAALKQKLGSLFR